MDAQLELHEGSQIADRFWRLNNLYTIQTKEGHKAPFRLNWAQAELLRDLHECSLILKAREILIETAATADVRLGRSRLIASVPGECFRQRWLRFWSPRGLIGCAAARNLLASWTTALHRKGNRICE